MSRLRFLSLSTVRADPSTKKAIPWSVTNRDNSFSVKFFLDHPANSLWGVSFATRLLKVPFFLTKIPY
jgi:hypothetical protein